MERCGGVKKCVGVWGEVRGEVWGVRKCVGVWWRCGEVCWGVGKVRGEVWGSVEGGVGKCVGV